LRLHYTEVDQPSRALFAQRVLSQGHRYHISVLEVEKDESITIAAGADGQAASEVVTYDSPIGLIHPSAMLVGVLRHASDLQNAVPLTKDISTIDIVDLENGTDNPCPDRFRALAPVFWELLENGQRVYPRTTWKYFSAAMHPRLFPSENFAPLAIVCNTPHPTLAHKHSLGHLTYSNMNQPKLRIGFRRAALFLGEDEALLVGSSREKEITDAYPAPAEFNNGTIASCKYDLLKFSIAPNFLVTQSSRCWLAYQ
jgi:hypothetical protein